MQYSKGIHVGNSGELTARTPQGTLALIVSLALFALATPLAKWLTINGKALGFAGNDAISFCNVLFVGNLCAAFVVGTWFGPKTLIRDVVRLGVKAWFFTLLASVFSVAIPTLMFKAFESTSIANIVLLGRVGPLLYAVVGTLVFGAKMTKYEWIGNGFVLLAVVFTALAGGGFDLSRGDVLALVAGICYCAAVIAGKYAVAASHTRVYMFLRNFISAVVFFGWALNMFGWFHFTDAFLPSIWFAVGVYSLLVVVLAQFAWYFALEHVEPVQIGSLSVISPVMGILYALLLLGELPMPSQWLALGLTATGMFISNLDRIHDWFSQAAPESSLAAN